MRIDNKNIETLLENGPASRDAVFDVVKKAREAKGLAIEEAAVLLRAEDRGAVSAILAAAGAVKERVFGKRVVLFAPLYLSNFCTNGCLYCGFRSANKTVARKALEIEEVAREAAALVEMGFKRVLLVTGEDPRWGLDYIIACVRAVYEKTGMRIVHVNAPPMDVAGFRELKKAGVGVFQAFQETYHGETYAKVHPWGMKKDFAFRLGVMDRALEAGFEDVGIGPLLGLYDFKFEILSSIAHSLHLYEKFGTHAHTISVPRLRPAEGGGLDVPPYPVNDDEFKKAVAVLRLTVPSAGVVISTREPAWLRKELLHIGASQLSAASRTNPGGYTNGGKEALEQFSTNDHRTLSEVMASIVEEGGLPSLCTSCYRSGRVGGNFTEKTMKGEMERFCHANAILTLKEYIVDSSNPRFRHARAGNGVKGLLQGALNAALDEIKDEAMKKAVMEKLKELENGKRDIYF